MTEITVESLRSAMKAIIDTECGCGVTYDDWVMPPAPYQMIDMPAGSSIYHSEPLFVPKNPGPNAKWEERRSHLERNR